MKILQCFTGTLNQLSLTGIFIGNSNTIRMERFPNLTGLYLSNTELMNYDFGHFKDSRLLEELDIFHNDLRTVENQTLPQLRDIYAEGI